jgi:hypothetical protein
MLAVVLAAVPPIQRGMSVLLLAVAAYAPYMVISGVADVVKQIQQRRAQRVFVVPTTAIRPTVLTVT